MSGEGGLRWWQAGRGSSHQGLKQMSVSAMDSSFVLLARRVLRVFCLFVSLLAVAVARII